MIGNGFFNCEILVVVMVNIVDVILFYIYFVDGW